MKSLTRTLNLYYTFALWMLVYSLNAVGNMLEWNLNRKRELW